MKMRLLCRFIALFAIAFTAPFALAQGNPVHLTLERDGGALHPGEATKIRIKAVIDAPYHIYSTVQLPDPAPLATTISADDASEKGLLSISGAPGESAPKAKFDKGFSKDVGIHEGTATFEAALSVAPMATPGTLSGTISVRSQACDDRGCLPPKTVRLPVTIPIEAGQPRPGAAPSDIEKQLTVASAVGAGQNGNQQDWLPFLATAFVAGLVTLLTPCVFPLIPVTLAFFTKLATQDAKASGPAPSILKYSLLYALGIVACFTGLGVVLSVVAGGTAARDFAINPWVNLVFTGLFVIFGLALLEVTEIRLPAKVQQLSASRNGSTLGILGMGLTFVVSAFTCTAPIVGSLLVLAANATGAAAFVKPIVGMLVFSTALALPFVLLSLFPGLLARLPKSGAWLTTLKGAMGFLELAAALKFLSTADIYWNWQLLTRPAYLAITSLILIAGGLWLLGILNVGFNTPSGKMTKARGAWAALFIFAGLYCLYGVSGRPVVRFIGQFLPPPPKSATDLSFLPTLTAGKSVADATKQLIFVDITGHTCTNCRDVEEHVMGEPEVKPLLEKMVRVRLFTDPGENATSDEAAVNAKYQLDTFKDATLPRYAILDASGKVLGTTDYTTAKDITSFAKWLADTAK
jgi:thiol:disulfide interchange protein DsbD